MLEGNTHIHIYKDTLAGVFCSSITYIVKNDDDDKISGKKLYETPNKGLRNPLPSYTSHVLVAPVMLILYCDLTVESGITQRYYT